MWILEHEGEVLSGKRVWLKPGSQQIFGRTKPPAHDKVGGIIYRIDDKKVSRKHIVISVSKVRDGDGAQLHTRSQVRIQDTSKFGTSIDGGDRFSHETKTLEGTKHRIQLGSYEKGFIIQWQPVVFTYSSKPKKADPTTNNRIEQLHALDIKTSMEYITGQTTHVVTAKRNLPNCLRALVNAKPVVTDSFVDAVNERASAQNLNPEEYAPSPLEIDFDLNWPHEAEYIPPAGQEPVPRPAQFLEPDTARQEIYAGLTFVFLRQDQLETLQAHINDGGGKALFFQLAVGKTTAEQFLEYLKSIEDKKRTDTSSHKRGKPVVIVRLSKYPDDMNEWATHFMQSVDQARDQRSIQQNEFLDAILIKDIAPLQQALPPDESAPPLSNVPPPLSVEDSMLVNAREPSQAAEPTGPEPPKATKPAAGRRAARRAATASRFTGFDDYVPPAKPKGIQEDTPMEDIAESLPLQESMIESEAHPSQATQSRAGRKRRSTPSDDEIDEEAEFDELLPNAAAIKRRRLEAARQNGSASRATEAASSSHRTKGKGTHALEQLQKAKKRATKEIDVRDELARLRREQEEAARKDDEENLQNTLEGMDISEIRGLVHIEEMEIRPRRERLTTGGGDELSERWDDRWNGRKNFKKFRRRGAERGPQPQKVIVSMEEVPQKKGFGLGDAYFLEESNPVRTKEDEARLRRRQGRRAGDDDSEAETGFIRRRNKKPAVVVVEDSEPDDEEEVLRDVAGTATSRVTDTQNRAGTQTQTQTQKSKGKWKRPAVSVAAEPPPAKKARGGTRRRADSSDDEETGFRFRKRG